jgi:dTDP-4-dehydrorhamnose 3,5-epimerase
MNIQPLSLAGSYLVRLEPRRDDRGYFLRTYDEGAFRAAGLPTSWVQENQAWSSRRGTLRGLHFQRPPFAESKLVRVLVGAILDVFVDLRLDSSSYGQWDAIELSADNFAMVYVPKGFAHGYCTLTEQALVAYRVDSPYAPQCEGGLRWDDPVVGIQWPVKAPYLSDKDRSLPFLSELTWPAEEKAAVQQRPRKRSRRSRPSVSP